VGPPVIHAYSSQKHLDRRFGLHLYDINIALGNLVDLAGLQSLAYQVSH